MRPRIAQELALLRRTFGDVEHVELDGNDWFRIAKYLFPTGWTIDGDPVDQAPIVFMANASYPTGEPYGFWTPANLQFGGAVPINTTVTENAAFGGNWTQFSWAPDGTWCTSSILSGGSNLNDWARSFLIRLLEGP